MKYDEFKNIMISDGWSEDRWSHLKFSNASGKLFRIKNQKISIRFEICGKMGGKNEWFKIWSGYKKNLSEDIVDKIKDRIDR